MTSSDGQRLMVLDTASMYFRAFFGVPEIKADDGTNVNAVRGLLEFIARLVTDYSPSHLVCAWDNDWRPQWRVDLLPSYKAHRVEYVVPGAAPDVEEVPDPLEAQVPIILEVLAALGHLRRRRGRLRGRRRHRHPRHRCADAGRRRHRRPRPLPARRRRAPRSACSTSRAGSAATSA